MSFFADLVDNVGSAIALPEMGISEWLAGGNKTSNTSNPVGANVTNSPISWGLGTTDAYNRATAGSSTSGTSPSGSNTGSGSGLNLTDPYLTGGSGGSGTGATSEDIAYLEDQKAMLNQLLGRLPTTLQQGLTRNQDEYNEQYGEAGREKERTYAGYEGQRGTQGVNKVNNFGEINQQANTGYRSLAALLGRASGTGSSAFRELLPDVVGKDVSMKRRGTLNTYGQNMQGIQKAQNDYDIAFEDVLKDLVKQKKSNEERLRGGIEDQRQTVLGQQATNAGALAAARGGDYNAIRAAQDPFRQQVQQSMNNVEGFFDKYRTPYQRRAAVGKTPELSAFTADRSAVEAQNQGLNPDNPYASLLRKRLQEQV